MAEDGDGALAPGTSVTLRDIAKAAGVDVSTVSRALDPHKESLVNAGTRARIRAAAENLGYTPHLIASALRRGRSLSVGVIVPDLGNTVYAPVVRGVAHSLDRGGYIPVVADTEDDSGRLATIVNHFLGRRVDALVVTAARRSDTASLVRCHATGTPVVLAVRTLPDSGLPAVLHDDEGGGALAARHLVEQGHRVLAQIRGANDVQPFVDRSQGFEKTATALGARVEDLGEAAYAPTIDEGRRLAERLLREHPSCTAIFAHNDMLALGVLAAVRASGRRCPNDVSIVGYNDEFFAEHLDPALTTVHNPSYELGRRSGDLAIAHIERPDDEPPPDSPDSIAAELTVRASTAAPPATANTH
ncbi:LacI family transcriptional regulator [Egibacter rhizosphaerae]|uniref:LacI family transcriptional regulator n=1 Tax=Egibacter rhizosphaerae TaxID=1670831 RepID=A0A411YHT7_9ACTN|nr:LacI family DNA-binding transcriptional regulator [Egibacter rhizosphaerae]QBI20895.1 LacI family transcriptional regulator [Egibacter rhizosphaerae]